MAPEAPNSRPNPTLVLIFFSIIIVLHLVFSDAGLFKLFIVSTTAFVAAKAVKPAHIRPHSIVVMLFLSSVVTTRLTVSDSALFWFIVIFITRYARLVISLYSFWKYKLATAVTNPTLSRHDVTLVIPTVSCSEADNEDFEECLTTCLINLPAEIIIVTDTDSRAYEAQIELQRIKAKIEAGTSVLQDLGPIDLSSVKCRVLFAGIPSKRKQLALVIPQIVTRLTLFVDDHVFLPGKFIESVIPAFEDSRVGLCGTNKGVRRLPPRADTTIGRYFEAFWNVMGAVYLARHNFEIRATNALDGGVFVISGRASVIRTCIIQDPEFLHGFTNERFLFGMLPPNGYTHAARLFARYIFSLHLTEADNWAGLGPDDDNFITRWIVRNDWEVKVQYSDATKIETTLGKYPKFLQQCLRWSRTTIRSNPCSLITDRAVWRRWPVTVWTTYIACLFNFALVWDSTMVYTLTRTQFYTDSEHKGMILTCFGSWIYTTKLIKPFNFFVNHPKDLFLFFFPIPAGPLFSYYHSFLKAWSVLTFWDGTWSGRPNLEGKNKD